MKKFLIAIALLFAVCAPALALCGGKGILSRIHEHRHSRREARHSTASQTMATTTRTTFRARGGVVMMSSGACDAPQK